MTRLISLSLLSFCSSLYDKIHEKALEVNIFSNMGIKYVLFRIIYLLKTKLGWQKKQFPTNPEFKKYIRLQDWKDNLPPFFFLWKKNQWFRKKIK